MANEIIKIQKEVSPIIKEANALSIEKGEDLKGATELLSQLNRWLDNVNEDKEKLTKPMMEALKEIRGRYKPIVETLEASVAMVKQKMSQYVTLSDKARLEAESRLSDRVERGTMRMETAVKKLDELEVVDKSVKSEEGSVSFVEKKNFEIVDFKELPDEYKLADEVAIRKAMKNDIEVPGVRYFVEKTIRNLR